MRANVRQPWFAAADQRNIWSYALETPTRGSSRRTG